MDNSELLKGLMSDDVHIGTLGIFTFAFEKLSEEYIKGYKTKDNYIANVNYIVNRVFKIKENHDEFSSELRQDKGETDNTQTLKNT